MNPQQTPPHQVSPRYIAIIPAAGVGSRMGGDLPKQYLLIAGKTVLQHTVACFLASPQISHTYVVVSPEDSFVVNAIEVHEKLSILYCGGESRRDTVSNGLAKISLVDANDWILVHDAARPGLTPELVTKLIDTIANDAVGGLLALPVVDTVKRVHQDKIETISREGLWLAQTPQMFRYALLRDALESANNVTDEASAIEAMDLSPKLVQGHIRNRKLTTPDDFSFLQLVLNKPH
jgi:2-C-methyl-D-erythritol 4-phosphate cytidylyltransferase